MLFRPGFFASVSLFLLLLAAPVWADGPKVTTLDQKSYLGTVKAGDHLALRASPAKKSLTVVELTQNSLDASCAAAISRAPTWLQVDLREALRVMEAKDQAAYCAVITSASAQTVDEIAFLTARLSPQDKQYATPAMVKENAELIYQVAPKLPYVELVEKGTAGKDADYYTTARYRVLKNGAQSTFELPRDLYYYWVVHPLLDMEPVATVDPIKGSRAAPPAGVSWRSFFLSGAGAALSPSRHHLLTTPNAISDASLAATNFGKAAAYASLAPSTVGPDEVVRGPGGEPVLVRFSPSKGTCNATYPMPDGVFFATTMPLEQAAAAGSSDLLENLLLAGSGRTTMRTFDITVYSPQQKESRKFLLVRDRLPFGLSADPNETLLSKNSRAYDVLSSSQFAALLDGGKLLGTDTGVSCQDATGCEKGETCPAGRCLKKPFINLAYNKIIVPSDQPRALYKVLSDRRAAIEAFVKHSGVFELHGATSAGDDWSDLTMPGGIKCTKQDGSGYLSTVKTLGNVPLLEVMQNAQVLWTGVRRCTGEAKSNCPSGDRPRKNCVDALDCVGWWSGQMLDRSVAEYGCLHQTSKPERSSYPQRIVMHHYGNCGEIQDVVGAASRAALIPSMLTLSMEDHVWNEFYAGEGQWYPYDTGWSDTPLRIGNWGVSGDGDAGGGKENAVMLGWRGDGAVENLLGRYKASFKDGKIDYEYTQHFSLEVTVLDKNRAPVDGAVVTLLTESYYSKSAAVRAIFGVTGTDGKTSFTLGDKRNFYLNVHSTLGHWPKKLDLTQYYNTDLSTFRPLVLAAEAKPGVTIQKSVVLSGSDGEGTAYKALPAPSASTRAPAAPDKSAPYQRLTVELSPLAQFKNGHSSLNMRNFFETATPGQVDLYLLDAAAYDNFKADKPFDAALVKEDLAAKETVTFELPDDKTDWLLVLSARRRARFGELVSAKATLERIDPTASTPDPTDPLPGDEGGCGCSAGPTPGGEGLLGLLLLALLAARRRRRGRGAAR